MYRITLYASGNRQERSYYVKSMAEVRILRNFIKRKYEHLKVGGIYIGYSEVINLDVNKIARECFDFYKYLIRHEIEYKTLNCDPFSVSFIPFSGKSDWYIY